MEHIVIGQVSNMVLLKRINELECMLAERKRSATRANILMLTLLAMQVFHLGQIW